LTKWSKSKGSLMRASCQTAERTVGAPRMTIGRMTDDVAFPVHTLAS
jgi:hypothetical protein